MCSELLKKKCCTVTVNRIKLNPNNTQINERYISYNIKAGDLIKDVSRYRVVVMNI